MTHSNKIAAYIDVVVTEYTLIKESLLNIFVIVYMQSFAFAGGTSC